MNSGRARAAVWAAIVLGGLLSLASLAERHRVESLNRAVTLAAEADQIEALGAAQGLTLEQSLERMSRAGLNAVVLGETTIGDLASSGALAIRSESLPGTGSPNVKLTGDPETAARVQRGLRARFPTTAGELGLHVMESRGADAPPTTVVVLHRSPPLLRSVAAGLEPREARAARKAGMELIARLANPDGIAPDGVRDTVAWAAELGARYYLPVGEQVLGRRGGQAALLESLAERQMLYCSPEFAKISGDSNAIAAAPERTVRLHAAQALEIDRMSLGAYIERYAKAASERNIRVLLLRPMSLASERPLDEFATVVARVGAQVAREGGSVRAAHPFEAPRIPPWLFAAIGLATAPLAVFVLSAFGLGRPWLFGAGGAAALLGAACWLEAARPYAALAATLLFPVAAFQLAPSMPRSPGVRFVLVSLVSLVGGLTAAGLLNGLPYMIRADQFGGVKVAVFLPIAAVGLYFWMKLADPSGTLRSPILWSQAILGVSLLAVLAFMALRTGNDNPAGVSGLELQIRSLLERFLVVRPRTKEFLIGHPALVVGLGMLALCQAREEARRRWGGWTALLLMVGAIGQTSIVNTMCHLHTPVAIGLVRVGIGMMAGGLLGGAIWLALRRFVQTPSAAPSESP